MVRLAIQEKKQKPRDTRHTLEASSGKEPKNRKTDVMQAGKKKRGGGLKNYDLPGLPAYIISTGRAYSALSRSLVQSVNWAPPSLGPWMGSTRRGMRREDGVTYAHSPAVETPQCGCIYTHTGGYSATHVITGPDRYPPEAVNQWAAPVLALGYGHCSLGSATTHSAEEPLFALPSALPRYPF